MSGISSKSAGGLENKKKYNGKEEQRQEFSDGNGLEWLDYGARKYDNQIGRWIIIDPHSEKYEMISDYSYGLNNPIRFLDIMGNDPGDVVVLLAGGDVFSNEGKGSTPDLVEKLKANYFNGRGGSIETFSSPYWTSQAYSGQYGTSVGLSTNESKTDFDYATQNAYDYIIKNYKKGGKVIIYGYSYGGVLAIYLEKRLEKVQIKVNFLVTVDVAAGPGSENISRIVSDNTEENLNEYQITPSSVGSHGDKNKRKDGSEKNIVNNIRVRYTDANGRSRKMNHDVIDTDSAEDVINAILNQLKKQK